MKIRKIITTAALTATCLLLLIPTLVYGFPLLVGADSSYIVLGGSMQPTLRPGDLAFTEKVDPAEIEVGDIVAVRTDSGVYMHRVVEKKGSDEGVLFRLKGDANEDPDSSYVDGSEIIGKTSLSLPMGYLYTKSGYVLIVATPLMLLAVNQAVKIYKIYYRGKRRRRGLKAILLGKGGRRRRKIPILDATSALLLLILVAGSTHMMAPYFISGGGSFFTDTESSGRNIFRAATWKVDSSMTCTVCPNSTINLGENITVSGSIIPARSGVTVTLAYEWNSTTITRTVTTDDEAIYEDIYTPDEVGTWTVQAHWEGDRDYYGAASEKVAFTVLDATGG